jgi:thioredoxin-related protein
MINLNKQINLALNLLIALVLVSIGVVVIKHYRHSVPPRDYGVPTGSKVSLPDIDWQKNGQTLLLVLDTGCQYCTASAPFYQEIARETSNNRRVQLIAALPQEISNSKQYLSGLNVPIDEIRQSSLNALGVKGTPTLILINSKGEVMQSWPGKLSSEKEREVLLKLGALNSSAMLYRSESSILPHPVRPHDFSNFRLASYRNLSTTAAGCP